MSNIDDPNLGTKRETVEEKPETLQARFLADLSKKLSETAPEAAEFAALLMRLSVVLDPDEASQHGFNIFQVANLPGVEDKTGNADEKRNTVRELVARLKRELPIVYSDSIDTPTFDELRKIMDDLTKKYV